MPSNVGVLEKPETLTAQCIVLDEFLAPQELQDLITYSLQHESEFQASEVISPAANAGVIDYEHRRSRVLMDIGKHEGVIVERIKSVLPLVLARLGMEESPIASVESQITASNDGDFCREHPDNGHDDVATREAAVFALARIGSPDARALVERRWPEERDATVRHAMQSSFRLPP